MSEKKSTKKQIDGKLLDSFLKANEAMKAAEATKKLFASKIIPTMQKLGLKTVSHKSYNITLGKKDTLEFGDDIKSLAEELKNKQEHAKLDGKFTVTKTSNFLMVTAKTSTPPARFCPTDIVSVEKKEPTKPKEVRVGKKLA